MIQKHLIKTLQTHLKTYFREGDAKRDRNFLNTNQPDIWSKAQKQINKYTFTSDYYMAEDKTVTVYHEGGFMPDKYDTEYRFPNYQVWVRSSDWEVAEFIAEETYNLFHKLSDFTVEVPFKMGSDIVKTKRFFVYLITAVSEPIRLGVNDQNIMEYSVNFDVTLTEIK